MSDLVLYDGTCFLCHRLNQFILRRDDRDRFRFAALQSGFAEEALRRHGREARDLDRELYRDLDTVAVIVDFEKETERAIFKARATLHVLRSLVGVWKLARILEPLPTRWLDWGYDFVARRRYRWFGRSETCLAPRPEYRSKFLDGTG